MKNKILFHMIDIVNMVLIALLAFQQTVKYLYLTKHLII